jgi:hypothetical protein
MINVYQTINRAQRDFTTYILYPSVTGLSTVIWAALRAEKFIAGFVRRSRK